MVVVVVIIILVVAVVVLSRDTSPEFPGLIFLIREIHGHHCVTIGVATDCVGSVVLPELLPGSSLIKFLNQGESRASFDDGWGCKRLCGTIAFSRNSSPKCP